MLGLPAGLGHLLAHFCGVAADKALALADWRVRPLPATWLAYARADTHYLLYIYDRLRAQLLASQQQFPEAPGAVSGGQCSGVGFNKAASYKLCEDLQCGNRGRVGYS